MIREPSRRNRIRFPTISEGYTKSSKIASWTAVNVRLRGRLAAVPFFGTLKIRLVAISTTSCKPNDIFHNWENKKVSSSQWLTCQQTRAFQNYNNAQDASNIVWSSVWTFKTWTTEQSYTQYLKFISIPSSFTCPAYKGSWLVWTHLATEFLLQLSHKPGMDLLKSLPQTIRNMDNNSFPVARNIHLSAYEVHSIEHPYSW